MDQDARPATDMLTPEEIEALRRKGKEARAYYQKAFADLRPEKETAPGVSQTLTPSEIAQLRRKDREASAYARKVFKRKPKAK